MADVVTYQCPNCGGPASFDPAIGKVVCSYCGTELTGDALETSIPLTKHPVAAQDTEHARTAEDFLPRAPWEIGVRDVTNTLSYSCPACAARIVADQSTVTTSCPYCGNNLLVQGIATYVDHLNMEKMHTAKESISAGINYDEEGLVITESWRAQRTHSRPSDALKDL